MKIINYFLAFSLLALGISVHAFAGETGFLFFGDFGTGEPPQYKVAKGMKHFCESQKCDFAALLGDNFYPDGVESIKDPQWKTAFENPYGPLNLDFFASLGNHDVKGSTEAQIAYTQHSEHWHMPGRYYTYTKGNADFFVLDTNDVDKKQLKWLKAQLEESRATWKIVYGHHPIYSSGKHGNTEELVDNLLPVIEGKVDFYLSGHEHNKQVLQKKSSEITFIISGAAAKPERLPNTRKEIFGRDTLGFAHLLLSDKKATLRIMDEAGEVEFLDSFPVSNRVPKIN